MATKTKERNDTLQALCRDYLGRLRHMAKKHGLLPQLNALVLANRSGNCVATEKEVAMLSRLCDDERISRNDVPKLIGRTYRECNDANVFGKIKKLKRVGIYSKVSAILYANKKKG